MQAHEPPSGGRKQDILRQALTRKTPLERAAFLDGACGSDAALRMEMDGWLASHEGAKRSPGLNTEAGNSPLGEGATEATPTLVDQTPMTEGPGTVIGRYKLLEQIGEGGFAVVYVAEQQEPVRRQVALKVIKLGMDTRQVVARFEAERQALALMDHPDIAKVFDAGATDSGRPFFVMELVKGIPITGYCDLKKLATRDRLDLFIAVCQAIQHAHQKGVIHRDIKPSNILVTVQEGKPVPKVIDFGIAKATQQRLTEKTLHTQLEQFIGTPAYMSPEQAEMSGLDIDTRSDIYSLGVLLYELLVGKTPFDSKELVAAGLDEIRRTIREKEPARPSTRLSLMAREELTTTTQRRGAEAPKLIGLLRGDLDWIVMKCLEKDRTRRYETVNGLARDIERHLTHEPVVARPPSNTYRLQKAFRRNKLVFTAAAAVAAALLVGLGIAAIGWCQARVERDNALNARREAQASEQKAIKAEAGETLLRRQAQAQELAARQRAYASDMNLAQQALAVNNVGRARTLLSRHRPQPGQKDLRRWEWRYLWQQCQNDNVFEMPQQPCAVDAVDLSPDGKLLATADVEGTLKLWDFTRHEEIQTLNLRGETRTAVAFSPTGKLLAMSSARDETHHFVTLINVETGQTIMDLPHTSGVQSIAFTPDEKRLVAWERNVLVWDLEKRQPIFRFPISGWNGFHQGVVAVSPDGRLLAIGGLREVRGIDLATGKTQFTISSLPEGVTALAFSPAGGLLAVGTGYTEAMIRLFDALSGSPAGQLIGHNSWVSSLRFCKDGRRLVSTSGDQTVRVWDVPSQRALLNLKGHSAEVWCVALTPDGQSAVSGSKDGALLGWDLRRQSRGEALTILPEALSSVEFSADNRFFYGVDTNTAVSVWDARSLRKVGRLRAAGTNVTRVLSSRDGKWLVAGTRTGEIRVIDAATRLDVTNLHGHAAWAVPVGFLSGEATLVTVDAKGVINQWEMASWHMRWSATFSGGMLPEETTLSDAPNTGFLLLCPSGRERMGWLSWWKISNSREEALFRAHKNNSVMGSAISPDGQLLATVAADSEVKLWSVATHAPAGLLRGLLLGAHSVAFSPDGDRLASGSTEGEAVKLWDLATQQEVVTLAGGGSLFVFTRFSPDGNMIVSINNDERVHLWRAPSWEEIAAGEKRTEAKSQ
jgi:WD40 repeat protein/serine/threonine protein kinase